MDTERMAQSLKHNTTKANQSLSKGMSVLRHIFPTIFSW